MDTLVRVLQPAASSLLPVASAALRSGAMIAASFAVAVGLYMAMYSALVPQPELVYPLHFELCDRSDGAARVAHIHLHHDWRQLSQEPRPVDRPALVASYP